MKQKAKEIKAQEIQRRIDKKINSILFPSINDNENINDPFIVLQNVNKIYSNDTQAVFDFNLKVKNKEFVVFVGPSGCGKSTTLRMICGLEEISSGELLIDNKYANDLAPKDRDVAMVFQSYALYPHMTVADNLGFSLKIKKNKVLCFDKNKEPIMWIDKYKVAEVSKRIKELNQVIAESTDDLKSLEETKATLEPVIYQEKQDYLNKRISLANEELNKKKEELESIKNTPTQKYVFKHLARSEIQNRVQEVAEILEIQKYLTRKPRALSGGQRQRVALGRAIVRDAKVYLMDEPLSNLDAKLRVQMRSELVAIHKKMGATTIYVTHDQTEAMTMADRIVIMKDGVVQQIGTPKDIYKSPRNLFVATFIGSPAMNILNAKYSKGKILFEDGSTISLKEADTKSIKSYYEKEAKRLDETISNLNIALLDNDTKKHDIYKMALEKANELKDYVENNCKSESFDIKFGIRPEHVNVVKNGGIKLKVEAIELLGSDYIVHTHIGSQEVLIKMSDEYELKEGNVISVEFKLDNAHCFDAKTDMSILN